MTNMGLPPGLNQDGWRRYEPVLVTVGQLAGTRTGTDGVTTSGSNIYTSASGNFTPTDTNSVLTSGLGSSTVTYVSPTTLMLSGNAGSTLSGDSWTLTSQTVNQPTLVTDGSFRPPFGRYLIIDHLKVKVEVQATLTSVSFAGNGAAYAVSLPFPANRWTGPGQPSPVPLGIGMCYLSGTGPNVNVPVTITLADPFPSLAGTEDKYIQAYCSNILSWGTGTLSSGTVTVTHNCGCIPRAEDIDVTFTDAVGIAAAQFPASIQNITSQTFDVVSKSGLANGSGFSWKYKGKPPLGQAGALMSPVAPWLWNTRAAGATAGNFFLQFTYEPRF